jgi:hypothetical protein
MMLMCGMVGVLSVIGTVGAWFVAVLTGVETTIGFHLLLC